MIIILITLSILFNIFFFALLLKYRRLYVEERYKKSSMSVKYGKFLENYIPWIKEIFPYRVDKFRFIGNPIDGIVFDENEIVFMEFKTGKSKLNESQKRIKKLVKEKKVKWKEIKIGQ